MTTRRGNAPIFSVVQVGDDEPLVHLPHFTGDCDSLCGLDGDDPTLGHKAWAAEPGAKVNCPACIRIFDMCRKVSERHLDRSRM